MRDFQRVPTAANSAAAEMTVDTIPITIQERNLRQTVIPAAMADSHMDRRADRRAGPDRGRADTNHRVEDMTAIRHPMPHGADLAPGATPTIVSDMPATRENEDGGTVRRTRSRHGSATMMRNADVSRTGHTAAAALKITGVRTSGSK